MREAASKRKGSRPGVLRVAWLVALMALVLAPALPAAAEVQISAALDRDQVPINQRATLKVTISGAARGAEPSLPELPSFTVVPAGSSFMVSSVNFKTTRSTVYSYILIPRQEGTFEIPPITVEHKGEELRTRALVLRVVAVTQQRTQPDRPGGANGRAELDVSAVRLEAEATPRAVVVGEQVTLVVRFYQDRTVDALDQPQYQRPATTGFWVEDLGEPRTVLRHEGDREYHVTEIRYALFPTETGEQTIGGARVDALLRSRQDALSLDPFRMFGRGRAVRRTVESEPITIQVRDLPTGGRPAVWNGAVGTYALEASVDRTTVEVGEAVTLTVVVRGQGNVRGVGDPELPEVPELRSYDGGSELEDTRTRDAVGGIKTLRKVFIASQEGTFTLPAIHYASFDPHARRYVSMSTRPIDITVQGGAEVPPGRRSGAQSGIDAVPPELRFIRLDSPDLRRQRPPLHRARWFLCLQLVPIVGLGAGLAYARHSDRVRGDVAYARSRRSRGVAQKRLKEARQCLRDAGDDRFWSALVAALVGYIADRTNRSAAGMTLDDARAALEERGVDSAVVERCVHVVERCDQGRFDPDARGASDRQHLLDETETVIQDLERADL